MQTGFPRGSRRIALAMLLTMRVVVLAAAMDCFVALLLAMTSEV